MGQRIKFSIHTLGCKVNQYESENIIAELKKFGWGSVDFSERADAYIINSCTVTAVANHKSRQLIRRAHRVNPEALIVVTGCYADSDRKAIEEIEGVGLVLGNGDKDNLPRIIAERLGVTETVEGMDGEIIRPQHTRTLVKIQDGCNQFCSYCIVPHVRGDLKSRSEAEVIEEVNRLVAGGTQEIVLTGIHLGLYGAEKTDSKTGSKSYLKTDSDVNSQTGSGASQAGQNDLGNLLSKLIMIPRLGRIRLSSIELNEISPRIVELVSTSGKICNHLHIPLQSGSNDVLSRMNRHYTAEEFIERTEELRRKIPNLAISTDVIVGFPGETESDFEDTVSVVERVAFSKLHVFKFSPRKGTPAAGFPAQNPNDVKDKRSTTLIGIGEELSSKFALSYLGKSLNVLAEREQSGFLTGVSDNYIRVHFEGSSELIGKLVVVEIIKKEDGFLYGKIS